MRYALALIVATSLLAACGDSDPGAVMATTAEPEGTVVSEPVTTSPSATTAPSPTPVPATSAPEPVPTTVAPTTGTSTTVGPTSTATPPATTLPPVAVDPLHDTAALAWGLFCRDLELRGYSYAEAVAYWTLEGSPARMDANGDGVPCATVYDANDVLAFWSGPFPETGAPEDAAAYRWTATDLMGQAIPACCDSNAQAPTSPPLPAETGPFTDDGAYAVEILRNPDNPAALVATIRRWIPCSEIPDQCVPDTAPGDVGVDPSNSVTRILPLDDDLTVVFSTLPEGATEARRYQGTGTAFSYLMRRFDLAYKVWFLDSIGDIADPINVYESLEQPVTPEATAPFGPNPFGVLGYRGPAGFDLVLPYEVTFFVEEGLDRGPGAMYGWFIALEIIGGRPVLFIDAGRVAG